MKDVHTVALDLFSPLKVVSWASAHADCPMHYKINSADEMVIVFGSGQHEFEFSLDKGALRTLNQLSTEALDKMDASAKESLGGAGSMLRHLTNGRPSER
jgi:hypothetical protein